MHINLNDTLFDDKPYSTRDHNRLDPSYIISDKNILAILQDYKGFEKEVIDNINNKKLSIYLRFCDGEYLYYKKKILYDYILKLVKVMIWKKDITSRWEKISNNLQKNHYDFFQKYQNIIKFCPMSSDSRIKNLRKSFLYNIILSQELVWHLYYVYHFLNKLRQGLIPELIEKKICYVTHNQYIDQFDHIQIWKSYNDESISKLEQYDFSSYDIILLGGWISSPLYSKAIAKTAQCPIIDSWYMLSIRNSKKEYNEWPFTHLLTSL